jgi:lipopolysaccharide transport system permease protein
MTNTKLSPEVEEQWSEIIAPENSLLNLQLAAVWRYRDLLTMFVKRDFISTYKQTLLGPLWFFLQPIFTTAIYVIFFGRFAGLSTDGAPMILFYLAGITSWNYFSECLNKTATVFKDNSTIFGKVYFPRLIMPLSIVASNLIKFIIQYLLFLAFFCYYLFKNNPSVHPNMYILITPLLIFIMAGLGLGFGMIISALTTKYRDLIFLLTFGVQLLMYATPVIYPLSYIDKKYQVYMLANPMTSIIETFRYAYIGTGHFSWNPILYSLCFMIVIVMIGTIIFNKVEKGFMDTV